MQRTIYTATVILALLLPYTASAAGNRADPQDNAPLTRDEVQEREILDDSEYDYYPFGYSYETYGDELSSRCLREELDVVAQADFQSKLNTGVCTPGDPDCYEPPEDAVPIGSGGSYDNKPHSCDPSLTVSGLPASYISITSGSSTYAGSSADIWMCIGEHRENYTAPGIDYDRPETLGYYVSPEGRDSGCFNLGQGPSLPNHMSLHFFCNESTWDSFFQYLEPDDWDHIRFWTPSTDGLQIEEIKIVINSQTMFEANSMGFWLDKYYNRQLILDWRIAEYKHDQIAAILGTAMGTDYLQSTLEIGVQDLGFSGARKYNGDDTEWCSEFALFAIQNGSGLSAACSGIPEPLKSGDKGVADIEDWLVGCGRNIPAPILWTNPSTMKPGYYLSLHGQGHSVIFVDWVTAPGGNFWALDGNGHCGNSVSNTVCLAQRAWNEVDFTDFAGNTY